MVIKIVKVGSAASTKMSGSMQAKPSMPTPSTKVPSPQIKLVDISKAAEFLNVSVSTVRRLRKSGAIRACPVAGRVMFNLFDLIAYVQQGQVANSV